MRENGIKEIILLCGPSYGVMGHGEAVIYVFVMGGLIVTLLLGWLLLFNSKEMLLYFIFEGSIYKLL